jgi:hypothetical protein
MVKPKIGDTVKVGLIDLGLETEFKVVAHLADGYIAKREYSTETKKNIIEVTETLNVLDRPREKCRRKKCDTCNDTGTFTNPFDQTFKCGCKKKDKK